VDTRHLFFMVKEDFHHENDEVDTKQTKT